MRRLMAITCGFLVLFNASCIARPPQAMITLYVINQDGKPVSDTEITASFWQGKQEITKCPDKNGYVTFSSPVIGDAVFGYNPEGFKKYYVTYMQYLYHTPSKNAKDGKWQPWNPIVEFVLCERLNPIPMYVNGRQDDKLFPGRNVWFGFDMVENDWVHPYGKGHHADIEVILLWDGKVLNEYTGATLKLRFPDAEAGYYAFHYEPRKTYDEARFKSPYHANPSKTYVNEMVLVEQRNPKTGRWEGASFPEGTGYVFRTRTRLDADGHLIGAYYGKIYQPYSTVFRPMREAAYLRLPFYLNPTENDTNLEFNPEYNLLKRNPLKGPFGPFEP